MTEPRIDGSEGNRAHCPQPKCQRRPLHPIPDGRLQCRRCCRRYAPDDPRIDWGPGQPMGRPPIGGPPIGSVLLGDDRTAQLDAYAAQRGLSRSEVIRRAVDRYLAVKQDPNAARQRILTGLHTAVTAGLVPGLDDPQLLPSIVDVVMTTLNSFSL